MIIEPHKSQDSINKILSNTYKMVLVRGAVAFPGEIIQFDFIRDKSLLALEKAAQTGEDIFITSQKDIKTLAPLEKDINFIGCIAQVRQFTKLPNGAFSVMLQIKTRGKIESFASFLPFYEVNVVRIPVAPISSSSSEPLLRVISEQIARYKKVVLRPNMAEIETPLLNGNIPQLVAAVGAVIYNKLEDKQRLLSFDTEEEQLDDVITYIANECEILSLTNKIKAKVNANLGKHQKEVFLREQIKVIHDELGDNTDDYIEYREKAEKKGLPKKVLEKVLKEITKLEKASTNSPENGVSRGFIEWILDMPWAEKTKELQNLSEAQKILDEDHYGIEKVKERIVEYLAVNKLTKEFSGPILCFVGPPGVGKTSIASSIARASNRKFVSMSLGGVRDEAEIRGHRRTYIGAMPGRIIAGLKNAGVVNPVFLLDEIDKMTADFRGDPASALLEVLDPNQNKKFKDHYLDVDYDLSRVMFITTANTLDSIPAALKDRMEIIELSGYTYEEKLQIAKKYLIKKQTAANGLEKNSVEIDDKAILEIIAKYTKESGVRNLERQIAKICRKIAVKIVAKNQEKSSILRLKSSDVKKYLGTPKYKNDSSDFVDDIGTATGLAYTQFGGTTLDIEVVLLDGGKGEIVLTGSLGEVMKESCKAALTLVRARAKAFNIDPTRFNSTDVHIHFPEGATPKDGPSAGIAIATAILSAFSNRRVSSKVGMTGEVTLRGKVLAIGGLKEKSLAAFRVGIRKIIIPQENEKDIIDLPKEVTDNLEIVLADNIDTVFSFAIL